MSEMAARLQPALAVHGKTRRPSRDPDRKRGALDLIENQRGAIMVIGIFIAMMLVGMLYYVWGIGGAVLFRERMNDASDASAFSAAVVHARGMNILALLNIIMAALAVVETAVQLAFEIITAAGVAAGVTCAACVAVCVVPCGLAIDYGIDATSAYNIWKRIERIIDPIMNFTHGVAVAVRTGSPIAGQALVVSYSQAAPYNPTVQVGVMFPLLPSMQAEDDPSEWPCQNKVEVPAGIAAQLIAPVIVSFNVWNPWYAGGAVTGLLRTRSAAGEWCPDYFQHVPDDSQLGEDPFQIRTLMYGRSPHEWTRGGVALADWGRTDGSGGVMDALEPLTYISFAQSEYFYEQPFEDDAHEHEEFLWHQRWRARLRRFRLPSGGGGGVDEACGAAGEACGSLVDLSSIVVH